MALRYFKHNKTGNLYILHHISIDATNSSAGELVAVYCSSNSTKWFTRELKEFYEKFTEV